MTIPLPGQPEHIRRAINERRKGGGVSQSGDGTSKEHRDGGGRTGSSAGLGGKQDAGGVDLQAASRNTHRRKTSDRETSDNHNSGGGGAGGRASGTRTRGRGRDGVRVGHRMYKGSQSQSEHVQNGARSPAGASTVAMGLGDTSTDADLQRLQSSDSAETPKQWPGRRKGRKRFRGTSMKPRHREVSLRKHVNNSVVIVPQNASDKLGAGGQKIQKENSEQNRVFRAQDTGSEGDSRSGLMENKKTRGREDNVGGRRERERNENQEKKPKDIHSWRSKNGRRKNGRRNEGNKNGKNGVNQQTEENHRHGQQEGRTPHVENTRSTVGNVDDPTRIHNSSLRETLTTEAQRIEDTTDSKHKHTNNADKRVTPGRSRNTGRRVDRPVSRSHRLRPTQRRKHPRRHRQRNQKKPTRRKGGSHNSNSTRNDQENKQSNLSRQQQPSLASRSPPSSPAKGLPAPTEEQNVHRGAVSEDPGHRQVGTPLLPGRTPHDHEPHQSYTPTNSTGRANSAEEQRHDHRSTLSEGQRQIIKTRRRNSKNQDRGNKLISSESKATRRGKVRASNSSLSEVTDNFTPDKTTNESLANGSGEIDKRGEEVGGDGAGGTVTSHTGREIIEKVRKNGRNTTLEVKQNREETNTTADGKYSKRRRWRKRKFRSERRRKSWSLRRKRLEQQRNPLYNKENTTQRGVLTSPVLGASQSENPHEANKTQSVEESVRTGRTNRQEDGHVSDGGMTDSPQRQISGTSQDNNKTRQHATNLSRRFDPSFSGSGEETSPGAPASGLPENKKQFLLNSRRDRKRHRERSTSTQPNVTTSKSASPRIIAHDAENQRQDTYQRKKSGDSQKGQEQTSHRHRHNRFGHRRHRLRRRRRQRKKDGRGRRSVEEVRHNAFYGLNRLLPPGEERTSAKWKKNDQRNRRELADPFPVVGDWRGSLRRSYFETLFLWPNTQERWRRLMPRTKLEKSSESGAGDFWFSVGSVRAVDPQLGTEIRGTSGKESQKPSHSLRRRRSVSKLAWETKAKMKTKRQNLLVALSQRCGRTGAGLLRSCGEPEMNCQPGEGDPREAEMVHGKCDSFNLDGNQSFLAEREPPSGKDRSPKRYLQQKGDTALVMVTDGGGEDGGGYQRRRRELRNLSKTPNVTYRCSPSHKYWLFASRWVRPLPEGGRD